MTPISKLLVGLSAVVVAAPVIMARFPHDFTDVKTYSFYFLAAVPAATTAFARCAGQRKWLNLLVMVFWWVAIALAALALCIWPTDAWAPVIWYVVSQGWLVGALILAIVAGLLRYLDKKKADPVGTDNSGAAPRRV